MIITSAWIPTQWKTTHHKHPEDTTTSTAATTTGVGLAVLTDKPGKPQCENGGFYSTLGHKALGNQLQIGARQEQSTRSNQS